MLDYKPIEGVTVIGLGHKARVGKDTTAGFIIGLTGGAAERFGFADDLYSIARVMFGMTTKDPTLLQVLGTEVFRKKDPDTWINSLYWKLQDRKPSIAVITDCRFPNEAAFVKALGGTMVKIVRLNADDSVFQAPDRNPLHPSESALNDYQGWDHVLVARSGDLQSLYTQVELVL